MSGLRIVRTSKTRVGSLQSFKSERPRSGGVREPELKQEQVAEEESGVGDVFQDLFGEKGEERKPDEVSSTAPKRHVRRDEEPEDIFEEEKPSKPTYSGKVVNEGGLKSSEVSQVEASELDDIFSSLGDIPPGDAPEPSKPRRPTSTPTKGDGNNADDADFGDGFSLIRSDDMDPVDGAGDKNKRDGRKSRESTDGAALRKPLSGGFSSTTTTTKFSSKFVPNIPESFYKDIQARIEDLIFKFECLDNEYAALQKISRSIHSETMEIKKKFTRAA